jgi:methylated-DNA-[protein]-cysteine S-methyltransferase
VIVQLGWRSAARQQETKLLAGARAWLEGYFAGSTKRFGLPLRPAGTAFEQRVWAALSDIPYGETRTYGEVAGAIGALAGSGGRTPRWGIGARAVGQAIGKNPIPIFIPCHRVLAAGGIGGFSAPGGVATKRALLALECRFVPPGDLFRAGGAEPDFTTSEARA